MNEQLTIAHLVILKTNLFILLNEFKKESGCPDSAAEELAETVGSMIEEWEQEQKQNGT